VVSDAGTPGIADPGAQIAAAAIAAGVAVFPIPGANAAISALIASGLAAETFTFHGFLPAKEGRRKTVLEAIQRDGPPNATQIFYEAPHRILATLTDVEATFGPAQPVVIARELTKLHEEFLRGPVNEVKAKLAARASVRGEIVLLLPAEHPATSANSQANAACLPMKSIRSELRELMGVEGLSEMDALKRVARARGLGKSEAYRELQRERGK
jgi:16S rRNA (cytidine1402-2'-O)-methyltransferase